MANFIPDMKPYTGQGKFRYWVQMVLPTIYDDSLSYMELLNKVVYALNLAVEDVGTVEENVQALLDAFNELQQYTNDYFDNLDVQEEINNKLENMANSGQLEALFPLFKSDNIEIDAEIVVNHWCDYNNEVGYQIDGAVYIGNDLAIAYYSGDSDDGILKCFNIKTNTMEWEQQIQGYHGNSLAYDGEYLYICGCYSVTDPAALISTIIKIDPNNPSEVLAIINPPLPEGSSGIYSLAYGNDAFYGVCFRGTTPGECNALYKFNKQLTEIIDIIILEKYPSLNGTSSQGVQLVIGNYCYTPVYSNKNTAIAIHSLTTGKLLALYKIKPVINGYRKVGEIESLIYNGEDIYFTARMTNTGYSGHILSYIAKTPILTPCNIKYPVLPNVQDNYNQVNLTVYTGNNNITNALNDFICLQDAIYALKNSNQYGIIVMQGAAIIGNIAISNSTCVINFNRKQVKGGVTIYDCNMRIINADFIEPGQIINCIRSTLSTDGITYTENSYIDLLDSFVIQMAGRMPKINSTRSHIAANYIDPTANFSGVNVFEGRGYIYTGKLDVSSQIPVPITSIIDMIYKDNSITPVQIAASGKFKLQTTTENYIVTYTIANKIMTITEIMKESDSQTLSKLPQDLNMCLRYTFS